MKDVTALLLAARTLIADEADWTQRAYARQANGEPVEVTDFNHACRWCVIGAIRFIDFGEPKLFGVADEALKKLEKIMGHAAVFNDTRAHKDVIDAIDRAIELSESEAA